MLEIPPKGMTRLQAPPICNGKGTKPFLKGLPMHQIEKSSTWLHKREKNISGCMRREYTPGTSYRPNRLHATIQHTRNPLFSQFLMHSPIARHKQTLNSWVMTHNIHHQIARPLIERFPIISGKHPTFGINLYKEIHYTDCNTI